MISARIKVDLDFFGRVAGGAEIMFVGVGLVILYGGGKATGLGGVEGVQNKQQQK